MFFVTLPARLKAYLLPWANRSPWHHAAYDFLWFGIKQGWACLFGGLMLGLLIGTHFFYPIHAIVVRYDFLVLAAIAVQIAMLMLRMERLEEAAVILIYHIVGTLMELFKTTHGSWDYPEAGVLKIGAVPLFSGFMYACIGSYIARAWRLFDFRFTRYPPVWATVALACLSYANFFADHYGWDMRVALFILSALLYGKNLDPVHACRDAQAHAAGAGFRVGSVVHLVGRELRDFHQHMDLSQPA